MKAASFPAVGACALAIAVACAACTTAPEKEATDSRSGARSSARARRQARAASEAQAGSAAAKEVEPRAPPPPSKAVEELRRGVQRYDDGEYKEAARHFQRALEQGSRAPPTRRTRASISRSSPAWRAARPLCRTEFRKAFEADPAFDLTPAEAGHPMWGPVFRGVKAEVAKKRKAAAPGAGAACDASADVFTQTMNLHHLLRQREAQRRPLRVGLIGAGKFGSMYLAQARTTPGVHVVAIADLSPDRARAALQTTGWPAERVSAASLPEAREASAPRTSPTMSLR